WFVGYSSQLTAAVWVGYPSANTPMHGVSGVADVAGGTIPAHIWHDVMTAAGANLPVEGFPPALPLPPGTRAAPPPPANPPGDNQPQSPEPKKKPPKRGH